MGANFVNHFSQSMLPDEYLEVPVAVTMAIGLEPHVGQPFGDGDQLIAFVSPSESSVFADEPPLINPECSDTLDSAHVECFSRYQWLVVGAPELVNPPHTLAMEA